MLKLIRKVCCSWWMTSVMSTGIEIVSRIPYPHHLSLTYIQWSQDLGSTSLKEESESESYPVTSDSLRPHGLYSPWNSLGQNTGVGSLSLLQGIFPTQGSNPGLPYCRWIFYQLSHKGSPRVLELVAHACISMLICYINNFMCDHFCPHKCIDWALSPYIDLWLLSMA